MFVTPYSKWTDAKFESLFSYKKPSEKQILKSNLASVHLEYGVTNIKILWEVKQDQDLPITMSFMRMCFFGYKKDGSIISYHNYTGKEATHWPAMIYCYVGGMNIAMKDTYTLDMASIVQEVIQHGKTEMKFLNRSKH